MRMQLHCIIRGKVQGVMFRDFAQRKARSLSIVGTVKNNPDGSVEIVSVGEEKNLRQFLDLLRKGPLLTRIKVQIDSVEEKFGEPAQNFYDFNIIY